MIENSCIRFTDAHTQARAFSARTGTQVYIGVAQPHPDAAVPVLSYLTSGIAEWPRDGLGVNHLFLEHSMLDVARYVYQHSPIRCCLSCMCSAVQRGEYLQERRKIIGIQVPAAGRQYTTHIERLREYFNSSGVLKNMSAAELALPLDPSKRGIAAIRHIAHRRQGKVLNFSLADNHDPNAARPDDTVPDSVVIPGTTTLRDRVVKIACITNDQSRPRVQMLYLELPVDYFPTPPPLTRNDVLEYEAAQRTAVIEMMKKLAVGSFPSFCTLSLTHYAPCFRRRNRLAVSFWTSSLQTHAEHGR